MKPATLELMETILATDDTLSPNDTRDIITYLKTRAVHPGTIDQAAEILGVCPGTVRRYAKAGLLTPIRITARNVQYDLNEVERLANTGRT
ncbi:hypothetical protein PDESU_01178 [Pontiella desulfatans]|uniref:HTH merR-type domain-containing protein n=1 Tax=Pontiella desulfatans TaxID=2750659 RepID=A0A6C2TYF0_PONDE|nr:MerR family transcriptional regulator [Pontiella desulfatans]VGO12625.1 hypothetical protein PDESU_01178 [Pontiella desulfatans]